MDGFWRACSRYGAVAARPKHRRLLGAAIRAYRKRKRLTQEKLAERAGLHHNYVGELERGEKAASIDIIVRLAKALGVRVRDLTYDL